MQEIILNYNFTNSNNIVYIFWGKNYGIRNLKIKTTIITTTNIYLHFKYKNS